MFPEPTGSTRVGAVAHACELIASVQLSALGARVAQRGCQAAARGFTMSFPISAAKTPRDCAHRTGAAREQKRGIRIPSRGFRHPHDARRKTRARGTAKHFLGEHREALER